MHKEVEYILSNKIKFGVKGEQEETDRITMTCPSRSMMNHISKMKSVVYKALSGVAELAQNASANTATAEEDKDGNILDALYFSGVDLKSAGLHDAFDAMAKAGCVKLDGRIGVTEHILDQINLHEYEGMIGLFIQNFILPSEKKA